MIQTIEREQGGQQAKVIMALITAVFSWLAWYHCLTRVYMSVSYLVAVPAGIADFDITGAAILVACITNLVSIPVLTWHILVHSRNISMTMVVLCLVISVAFAIMLPGVQGLSFIMVSIGLLLLTVAKAMRSIVK